MATTERTRLNQHLIAAQTLLFRSISGGLFELMPTWVRGYSGLELPIFNIFMPTTPAGLSDDTLADTAAFFFSRQSMYAVEIMHDLIPEGPDFLYQRHYTPLPPQPAMVLRNLPTSLSPTGSITVCRVTTVPELTAFCSIQNNVFDFDLRDLRKRFPVHHLKEDRISHYLAFIDEQPVATGSFICTDGVASLWNVCTIDTFRRQGAATAVLQQMLVDIWQRGGKLAMLYATAQAFHFFSKFGFTIYSQRQWFLPPSIDFADDADDAEETGLP
jgi:ribosomal protein S18 acetylase RimI-like enzyme